MAAGLLGGILENVRRVLAIELICAAQALEFLGPSNCGTGTAAAYTKIRQRIPMVREDRALAGDIEAVTSMISDGSILGGRIGGRSAQIGVSDILIVFSNLSLMMLGAHWRTKL